MTRILQIRRGTSVQNDNFTGLNGEITFDTTNKTLRVHDGETLGGFALARADEEQGSGSSFDITSVSSDFWETLFAQYQTAPENNSIKSESTSLFTIIDNVGFFDKIFDECTVIPMFVDTVLVCQTPEAGYAIGEVVHAFGIGDYTGAPVNTYLENGVLHARLMAGGQSFWVARKSDGVKTNITNANWKLKITVYY